jgi:hypothetical protein
MGENSSRLCKTGKLRPVGDVARNSQGLEVRPHWYWEKKEVAGALISDSFVSNC